MAVGRQIFVAYKHIYLIFKERAEMVTSIVHLHMKISKENYITGNREHTFKC